MKKEKATKGKYFVKKPQSENVSQVPASKKIIYAFITAILLFGLFKIPEADATLDAVFANKYN